VINKRNLFGATFGPGFDAVGRGEYTDYDKSKCWQIA
jgi:hypothetical protein